MCTLTNLNNKNIHKTTLKCSIMLVWFFFSIGYSSLFSLQLHTCIVWGRVVMKINRIQSYLDAHKYSYELKIMKIFTWKNTTSLEMLFIFFIFFCFGKMFIYLSIFFNFYGFYLLHNIMFCSYIFFRSNILFIMCFDVCEKNKNKNWEPKHY